MASATAAGLGVLHPRRAHDPVLHLLLDVRLPAHRRLDLGDGRPAGARLPDRRHRRPHDADRRGPAARRRPLAAARRDQPGGRALRPGVRLRGQPHHAVRPRADVRQTEAHPTARTSSSTSPSTTSRSRSPRSPRTSTSRASCAGIHQVGDRRGRRPAGAAAGLRRRLSRGSTRRARLLRRGLGRARPTPGRSPRGTSWPATRVAAEEWNLLHPDEEPRTPYVTDKLAGRRRPGRRRLRLHARGAAPDRALGARRLPGARRRRVRLRRHPSGRPPVLPHRRRVGRRAGAPGARRRRRGRPRQGRAGVRRSTASTTPPPSPAASRKAATPERSQLARQALARRVARPARVRWLRSALQRSRHPAYSEIEVADQSSAASAARAGASRSRGAVRAAA